MKPRMVGKNPVESDSDRIIQIRELYMAERDIHGNIHGVGNGQGKSEVYLPVSPSQ